MDGGTVFLLMIGWFLAAVLGDAGLFLACAFGWASVAWGWYLAIALIGIVPLFLMLAYMFYAMTYGDAP